MDSFRLNSRPSQFATGVVVYFNSPVFLYLFLPAVLLIYHGVPAALNLRGHAQVSFTNAFLFLASLFFYAWGEFAYVLVLFASLVLNYGFARAAEWLQGRNMSTLPLAVVAVLLNLALLIWYKYAGFLAATLATVPSSFGLPEVSIPTVHLPIGISFFTFQAISYIIDVCRKDVPTERSFLKFGLYVFLFPHLIAGPIVRYRDIAGQLSVRPVGIERFAVGVRRLGIGLAKKLLLADTFAEAADAAFGTKEFLVSADELTMAAAWLGLLCYGLQIYFDFSGYSDMAIGLGKMFGFDFLENFRYPYIAQSITEFWRRWHISLSSWFRDYVYVPLGGNRQGTMRTYVNLLIVFVLCGIWHGANWTFLFWGLYHGVFLILERLGLGALIAWLPRPIRHGYLLLSVGLGWVLFRATDVGQVQGMFRALGRFEGGTQEFSDVWNPKLALALPCGLLACTPIVPALKTILDRRGYWWNGLAGFWGSLGIAVCYLGASMQLAAKTYSPFIYFRF